MHNVQTPLGIKLKETTLANIGKDLSPQTNEFGCQETVCTLLRLSFGDAWKTLSTKQFYDHVLISPYYAQVFAPLPGDIILSPTGWGNGRISNGHVGIVLENNLIASNDSYTSKLSINYNIKSWTARYKDVGGFPVTYWRRISSPI